MIFNQSIGQHEFV